MRVLVAVNDAKTVDRIVAGALHYGISDTDEIAVITVTKSLSGTAWALLPELFVAEIERQNDEDAKIVLREAGQYFRSELHSPHVTEFMLDGAVVDQLNQFIDTWKADLLVVGYSENPPWADQASRIAEQASCPVLIVGKHKHEQHAEEQDSKRHHKWWREPSYII